MPTSGLAKVIHRADAPRIRRRPILRVIRRAGVCDDDRRGGVSTDQNLYGSHPTENSPGRL